MHCSVVVYMYILYGCWSKSTKFDNLVCAVAIHSSTFIQYVQVRPGTENDDLEETIQTVVLSDMKSGQSPPPVTGKKNVGKSPEDPESSLITDFQIITDIRVSC